HRAIRRKKWPGRTADGQKKNSHEITGHRSGRRLDATQLAREGEVNVFLPKCAAFNFCAVAMLEIFDALLNDRFGGAGAGGNDHGLDAIEPAVVNVAGAVDELGGDSRFPGD